MRYVIVAAVVAQSLLSAAVGFYVLPKVMGRIYAVACHAESLTVEPPLPNLTKRVHWVELPPAALVRSKPAPPPTFIDDRGDLWHIVMLPPPAMPDGIWTLGFTVEQERIVYVNQTQSLTETQDTVIHELCHVVLGTANSGEEVTVHEVIYKEAPRLQKIFANNPELTTWLARKEP